MAKFEIVSRDLTLSVQHFMKIENGKGETKGGLKKKNPPKTIVDIFNKFTRQVVISSPIFKFQRYIIRIDVVFIGQGVGSVSQFFKQNSSDKRKSIKNADNDNLRRPSQKCGCKRHRIPGNPRQPSDFHRQRLPHFICDIFRIVK